MDIVYVIFITFAC